MSTTTETSDNKMPWQSKKLGGLAVTGTALSVAAQAAAAIPNPWLQAATILGPIIVGAIHQVVQGRLDEKARERQAQLDQFRAIRDLLAGPVQPIQSPKEGEK